ncbi:SRPBCC family protein [Micromonospora sp. NPDC005237]|uniref:SRPBCC family protein n=1 Tax=Micromonospora sp. NPDC005237 TaxID=3155113 RepID=UPI0033BCAC0E
MTFHLDLDIAAPAGRVFDFVADFTTMPRWYSAVRRVERVGGAGGLGTRYEVYRDLPGGPPATKCRSPHTWRARRSPSPR